MAKVTPYDRVLRNTEWVSGDCLIWKGAVTRSGYGQVKVDGKCKAVHRVVYRHLKGTIPEGYDLDHQCRVKTCVNIDHLKPKTRSENRQNLSGAQKNNKSGYRNVYWNKLQSRWAVQVVHNKVRHFGGYFTDVEEADRVARELRNKFFSNNLVDRN